MNPPPPDSGQLLAGKYRVERVIGEGGMGTVLAARHELLDVAVAVKVLSAELTHQPAIIARFLREARAVARLKSEHVARVMDVGTLPEGQPYIVMELLEGEDLEKRVARGPLPVAEAADFILQTLEAIAHAHVIGIVHRDLKPANLFVNISADGTEAIKVLDFGIAKLTHAQATKAGARSGGGLTGEHATLGSPSYMAPEQVRAAPEIDARVDIWALGAIFYELLTGATAFPGNSVGEIFGAVLHSTLTPVRQLRPEVPEAVEAVIARCLQRLPEQRYPTVFELAKDVAPFGTGKWQSHVGRIEQTLLRAGKSSDPERSRASKLGLEAHALEAFGPESRTPKRPFLAPAAPGELLESDVKRAVTAHDLSGPTSATPSAISTTVSPAPKRRMAGFVIPAAAAVAGAGLAVALFAGRSPAPPEVAPRAKSVSTMPPPADDVPAVTLTPNPAPALVPEAPAAVAAPDSPARAPTPSASASPKRNAPPARPASTPGAKAPSSSHPPNLPGLLQSPD
jgi:serine/threonine-protein kinase